MSNREDRLKSLLDKVRAKRAGERTTHAADVLERIRTASGAVPAVEAAQATPSPVALEEPPIQSQSDFAAQLPATPLPEPDTSPTIDSPTRYSSQPPRVERPLSVDASLRPTVASHMSPGEVPTALISTSA